MTTRLVLCLSDWRSAAWCFSIFHCQSLPLPQLSLPLSSVLKPLPLSSLSHSPPCTSFPFSLPVVLYDFQTFPYSSVDPLHFDVCPLTDMLTTTKTKPPLALHLSLLLYLPLYISFLSCPLSDFFFLCLCLFIIHLWNANRRGDVTTSWHGDQFYLC